MIRRSFAGLLVGLLLGLPMLTAVAASPVQPLEFEDPAQQARYQRLIAEFRCPLCLNTNLQGSDAPIATDLRNLVLRLMREGKNDVEIRDYLQERYGDFVLYNPPFKPSTYVLWLGPGVIVLLAALLVWRTVRGARDEDAPDLDPERLAAALGEESDRRGTPG